MGIPEITGYRLPTAADLPDNTARWELDLRRAVLLIHDMQRYFLRPFPTDREPLTGLVANTTAVRERCAQLGVPVAYTAQPGGMTDQQRGLLQDFWGPGMTMSAEQRAVVDELAPTDRDWVFTKWRYSAFHRSDLLERMREHGRDQLIACGVYAHVGVLMSAVDAFTSDIQPFLVADAIADFTAQHHHWALEYTAGRCGVVTTTATALDELGRAERAA